MLKYLYAVNTCKTLKDMGRLLRVQPMALNKTLFQLAEQGLITESEAGGHYELTERGVVELGDFVYVYEKPSELPSHIAPVAVSGGYAVKVGNYIIPTPLPLPNNEVAMIAAKKVALLCKAANFKRVTQKYIAQLSEIMSEAMGDLVYYGRE